MKEVLNQLAWILEGQLVRGCPDTVPVKPEVIRGVVKGLRELAAGTVGLGLEDAKLLGEHIAAVELENRELKERVAAAERELADVKTALEPKVVEPVQPDGPSV